MPTIDLGPCECCGSCCFEQIRSFDFTFHAEPTGPAPPEIENNPNYCLERCAVTFTGSVSIAAWNPALFNPWPAPTYYGEMRYEDVAFSTTCSSPDVQWQGYARVAFYCNGPGPYVRVETSWIYANKQYCGILNGSAGPMGGYDNSINGGMAFVISHYGGDNEQLAWPCDVLGVEQTLEVDEYPPPFYNFNYPMARKKLTFTWNSLP